MPVRSAAALTGFCDTGRRFAELHEQLAHLVARDRVAALVRHGKAVAQALHGFVALTQFDQAGAEQLEHLGELRAQFKRAAQRLDRFLVLAVFHQQLR